jgi:hypothetical protein
MAGSVVRALIAGDAKKDPTKLTAKSGHNVTIVASKPPGYLPAQYARTPWLDVSIESGHVWGCTGRVLGRAAHLDDSAIRCDPPLVDLTTLVAEPLRR